ncbi:MAG: repair protein NreA [Thermoplasmata archaeon]|nr:repair protein NreA [Thermoplasmata archaeon]
MLLHEPCARCGRTLLEVRQGATRDAMRGSALLCSVPGCPLVEKLLGFAAPKVKGLELVGPSPPSVFVGRHGYPDVSMGPLLPATPESAPALSDSPEDWKKLDIATILAMRARLYRSKAPVRVDVALPTRALEASRELAMAARPVDAEVTLKKPLRVTEPVSQVDAFAAPMGPSVDVVDARLLSSPSVPRKVDALVSDVHADAATAVNELYEGGVPNHHIQRLLSVGLLGEGERRRLVPTRWSITATDDILGKQMIEEVKEFGLLDAPLVHAADLFGNYFQVLLMPRAWSYEMIEAWHEDGRWQLGRDAEGYRGRTAYVEQVAGAYYAARLSVLEHLKRIRRQAAVFVYREITDEYWAPLGVWVIREAVKAAMDAKPLVFGDLESALRHVARRSRSQEWTKVATSPREALTQRTLHDFDA